MALPRSNLDTDKKSNSGIIIGLAVVLIGGGILYWLFASMDTSSGAQGQSEGANAPTAQEGTQNEGAQDAPASGSSATTDTLGATTTP